MDGERVRGRHGVPGASGRVDRRRWGRDSKQATRSWTSPAATAAWARRSSRSACATGASTRRRRWSAAARARLGQWATVDQGDLNHYVPREPVAATTVFRAIYYARDRRAFFAHAREYTTTKLVFDLNPRQYRVEDVLADLRAGGFTSIVLRPFFVPQTVSLPRPALAVAKVLERSGPFARLALRARFTYLVVSVALTEKRTELGPFDHGPEGAVVAAADRVDLARVEGRRDRDLHAPGHLRWVQRRPLRFAVRHEEAPSLGHVLDPRLIVRRRSLRARSAPSPCPWCEHSDRGTS